jgi:hypothetical protein
MKKLYLSTALLFIAVTASNAQIAGYLTGADSITAAVHASYNKGNRIHRFLFGENFRKEWAAQVKLPLIDINKIEGGLTPVKLGGGMETKSIRMLDKAGQEWVIRSVEKIPDKLLPEGLRQTFALDWVDDEYSGQHPYAPLIIPPLAEAAGVPHTHPVIGVLAENPLLGSFGASFAGRIVLLEEREPGGKSDNTFTMLRDLKENNRNRIDGDEFLRARLIDLLTGDWDRHEDQWRWLPVKKDNVKIYTAVPRDRDQVFHVNEGVFPNLAALPWIDPVLGNFNDPISHVKYNLYKTRFIQQFPDAQFTYKHWMEVVDSFVRAETDQVLESALAALPVEVGRLRHDELLANLKRRRDRIPAAMKDYYYFINRIVDLRLSDKDELVNVSNDLNGGMRISVVRAAKNGGPREPLLDITYDPAITKEIRLYVSDGDDQIRIDNPRSPIRLRIIGESGHKAYELLNTDKTVHIYGRKEGTDITGNAGHFNKSFSNDTLNTRFVSTDPYNIWMPLATAAINKDDGFLLGLGFRYTGHDGFRKTPYTTIQEVMLTHSFATNAFRINYLGQWRQVAGKADFTLAALVNAPDNTMNFFGQGNATVLNRVGDYRKFYRTRFDLYQLSPALRWETGAGNTLSAGPSLEYYRINPAENADRSLSRQGVIRSYDSTGYQRQKLHAGLVVDFTSNKRDNRILPASGYFFNLIFQAYGGINKDARGFVQLRPEFTYYQKIDTGGRIVLSDRIGGGISLGHPAFYQSMFLGGQGNLLGYLQNRFAGQQMVFNNFQARVKLGNVAGYILPGQIGLAGFYDIGRVWINNEHSALWHQGTGGGLYFCPAGLTVVQLLAGHSSEGWYPYISLNFRI